jgi:hypothetical protein
VTILHSLCFNLLGIFFGIHIISISLGRRGRGGGLRRRKLRI